MHAEQSVQLAATGMNPEPKVKGKGLPRVTPTDDGCFIPAEYADFADVFSKAKAETLPPHRPTDHSFELEPGAQLPKGRLHSLSEVKLKALKAYIDTFLPSGFIR